ncbi:Bacteriophage Rz lysis protein [Pseudomonas guariconensis]|uniref:Lysis protein n=1 Tax=Pseudomonas putida TaxID=303 RepID=A0A6S5DMN5_PSEPU|nr:lysis protein [Pseudomonas putida]BBT38972.1 lysis protein [Pseudomonas putida]SDD76376.1 Bacteriophage Rz lysis protein [Pseudomonas guariconensis]
MLSRLWLGLCLVLVLLSSALTWQVQAWRYGRLFAQQAEAQAHEAQARAEEAARALLAEREGRQQLEQRLQGSETRHFQELAHAQQTQARLRDRLATADLRLSVLVEQGANCPAVPAPSSASGVDHGPVRARLDPADARRIIAITDTGDRGLIALRACQDYIRALAR